MKTDSKLKPLKLKEIAEQMTSEYDEPTITTEDKAGLVNELREFSNLGNSIYGTTDMKALREKVAGIVDRASQVALSEAGDSFDKITINRHLKQLKEAHKIFEKTAQEMEQLRPRMESAYDDIGQILGKYFEVH